MALRAQSNAKGRVRTGSTGGLSGVPGTLFGQIFGAGSLRGGLTASLKGSISASAVLTGGVSLKRALVGNVPGGATFTSNLSGGPGQLRGTIPHTATITGGLAASLRGSVSGAAVLTSTLTKTKALAGNVPGAATFTSTLTGAGGMPSGATYIHYADQYQSAGKVVPNAASTTTPTANIVRFGRGGYSSTYWDKNAVTVTDAAGTGITGLATAARLVCTAGSNGYIDRHVTLPAGSYIACFSVKSNTGASQTVRLNQSAKTITTAWQRFTVPITQASSGDYWFIAVWENGSGFDILVDDIAIYAGSVDLGVSNDPSGELWVDHSGASTKSTVSGNVIDFSTGDQGWFRFPSAQNPSAGFTAGAFVKGANTANYADILLTANGSGFSTFSLMTMEGIASGPPRLHVGDVSVTTGGRWSAQSMGWHLLTYRFDGSTVDIFFDDVIVFRKTGVSGMTALALKDMALMAVVSPPGYKWAADFYYPTALSDTQIKTGIFPEIKQRMTTNGVTPARTLALVHDGDSESTLGWWNTWATNTTLDIAATSAAVAGSVLTDMQTRYSGGLNKAGGASNGLSIYTIFDGANTLAAATGADDTAAANNYLSALFAHLDTVRAGGFKVGVCTILPRNSTSFNARRAVANPAIRAAVGTHLDFVIDFAQISGLGADADASNTTTYPDGLHPSNTAQAFMESDATYGYTAVVTAYINSH